MAALTLRQVAARLGCSYTTARGLLTGPDPIPHLRVSAGPRAGVRVPEAAFEAWVLRRLSRDTGCDSAGQFHYLAPVLVDVAAGMRRDGAKRRARG